MKDGVQRSVGGRPVPGGGVVEARVGVDSLRPYTLNPEPLNPKPL